MRDDGTYDYVIIGAGSAGCLLANRLSTNPDARVLLIEAGGPDDNFWLHLPIGYFRTLFDDRYTRNFHVEPSETLDNRQLMNPKGRVLGGSSAINGLVAIRGQHEDFDDWERLGATGWSFDEVLPYFRSFERNESGANRWRGGEGELGVSDLREHNRACDAWLAAAEAWGLPHIADFNGETTYGSGRYQLTLTGRWRASASRCFVRPIRTRPNLTIALRTHVTRILFEGRSATGVEARQGSETAGFRAAREVILAAGAIQSPQVLQLSGIGPADHLRGLGIGVVHDTPEVGENLMDHLQMRAITELSGPGSLNRDTRNPLKLAEMALRWVLFGTGPLTIGAGQVGGSACTKYAKDGRPDLQLFAMPLSLDRPGKPLHDFPGFTTCVWQCRPTSRGSVHIASADPFANPVIRPNYLATEEDRKVTVEGLKIVREIQAEAPFARIARREAVPGPEVRTDDEIRAAIRRHAVTVYHHAGTCRMGGDDRAVVDPALRVNGVERLRVIDASVMPQITSCNTNLAVMMIAEKGATEIIGKNLVSDRQRQERTMPA